MKYRRNIPYTGEEEKKAICDVMDSKMLVRGKVVTEFEEMFAKFHNKKYAVCVSSCTAALQLAIELIHRRSGIAQIIIPDYTFMATGHAVQNMDKGYKLADIDLETYNIDFESAPINDGDVLMPMHCFGNPVKMPKGLENHFIIEDCATAAGSEGTGYGDIQCYSFHGSKIMTTGIGGMLTMDDKEWADLAEELSRSGRPHWRQRSYNYQISNINAAIGIEQLKKLPYILEQRRKYAQRYNDLFKSNSMINVQKTNGSNYQSYVVRINGRINRDELIANLRKHEIEACKGNFSLSRMGYFYGAHAPKSHELDDTQLCLPLYVTMTDEDQDFIVNKVNEEIKRLT